MEQRGRGKGKGKRGDDGVSIELTPHGCDEVDLSESSPYLILINSL